MKLGKTTKLVIVFLSLFVILFVAYYTVDIIANNYVSAAYEENISLTGARLSDEFYSSMTQHYTQQQHIEKKELNQILTQMLLQQRLSKMEEKKMEQ